ILFGMLLEQEIVQRPRLGIAVDAVAGGAAAQSLVVGDQRGQRIGGAPAPHEVAKAGQSQLVYSADGEPAVGGGQVGRMEVDGGTLDCARQNRGIVRLEVAVERDRE